MEKVAITTGAGTALTTESYVAVAVHVFTGCVVQSATLQTRSTPERHTAEYMAHVLQAGVEDWGIADRVVCSLRA